MEKKNTGIIFDIKKFAIHDGPGIRTTVFFKGCPLSCWWCHNPEGYETAPQSIRKPGHDNAADNENNHTEIIGREVTIEQVIHEIEKDIIFYDESDGGVTFSGGEPLLQPDFLYPLLVYCKEKDIHVALDTTGYVSQESIIQFAPYIDLFLFDLKFIDNTLHRKYTGVSNEKILANLEYLCKNGEKMTIRIPIIPAITDTQENITQLGEYISSLGSIKRVDILAFHHTGRNKFKRLGLTYKMGDTTPPDRDHMNRIKETLETYIPTVTIGG